MTRLICGCDWAATPLGPVDQWSERLRLMVEQVLASPLVSALVCGPERILIYNDAAARLYGDRHPGALGRPLPEAFPESWPVVAPLYERVFAGESVQVAAQPLDVGGRGEANATVFDAYLTPVRGPDGQVFCAHMIGFEIGDVLRTTSKLRERGESQAFLLMLGDRLRLEADARSIARTSVTLLAEHMGLDRAYVAQVDKNRDLAEIGPEFRRADLAPVEGVLTLSDFPEAFAQVEAATLVLSNTAADPTLSGLDRGGFAALRMGALIVASARKGTRNPVWALLVATEEPRRWTAAEVVLVEDVAERTWAAVERARAEEALSQSEERYRSLFNNMAEGLTVVGVVRDDAGRVVDQLYLDLNGAAERQLGVSRDMFVGRRLSEIAPKADFESWMPIHAHVADTGEPVMGENYSEFNDRWYETSVYKSGEDKLIVFSRDISERKLAEAALRESEERFQQFGAASSDILWIRNAASMQFEYVSPAFDAVYGLPRGTVMAGDDLRRWLRLIEPEDRVPVLDAFRRVRNGERVTHEFRIRRPSDGARRWVRNTDFPLHDAQGRVERIGGIGQDVTEAKEMADRMGVLVAELQHRTRNLMGVVDAVSEQTARSASDLAGFMPVFRDRMGALARVNGLLSRLHEGSRITFDELIGSELAALGGGARQQGRVTLEGPPGVALRSSTVQTFALALHELATNAVKYGALRPNGNEQARLAVRWRVARENNGPWLHVDWRESGVALPLEGAEPRGGGSGRTLIERALPYQLKARTSFVMEADGVHCTIALPVSTRGRVRESADA